MSGRQAPRRSGGNGKATAGGVRFQESVGTLFAAWLLSGQAIDHRLRLANATVASVAAEADSPVDDLLVATSDGGYVAVQAKSGLSLSDKPGRRFHDTITQFVNHWRTCARGDGELGWNRPLDPAIDRLVIAVDPKTPATVRRNLPAAIRFLREPGSAALSADKQRAVEVFRSCVRGAWSDATGAPPDPGLVKDLAQVVEVFEFDPSDRDRMERILEQVAGVGTEASSVLAALESESLDMMAEGSHVDQAALRQRLLSKGVLLTPPKHVDNDVNTLREPLIKSFLA